MKLEKPIVFFDVETTGVDTSKDQIIEIALIKLLPDMTTETKTRRIKPIIPISEGAQDVHGISEEDLKDCPTFVRVAKSLFKWISGCDIAGFNSNAFDVPILYAEFERAGIEWDYSDVNFIDVSNIYRIMNPRTLVQAYKDYCGKDLDDAHEAEADTIATLELFFALKKTHKDLPETAKGMAVFSNYDKEMLDVSGKFSYDDDGDVILNFGKHRGKKAKDHRSYLAWMHGSNFPSDTKKVIESILTA